jgi:hypothetical protein
VAYEEIFAANVTPKGSHLQETYSFFTATFLYCHRFHLVLLLGWHIESRRPVHFSAFLTEAFESWFFWGCGVATLLADEPASRATQHRVEVII